MSDTHLSEPLLQVKNVKQHFPVTAGLLRRQVGMVKAVDGVDFDLFPRENLGLVGESGCGKTTLGRTILHLYRPTEGQILFKNADLTLLKPSALRALRPKMQMIFQDPQDSLNPRMTVGSIIAEPLDEHSIIKDKERSNRIEELLDAVGLNPRYTNRYTSSPAVSASELGSHALWDSILNSSFAMNQLQLSMYQSRPKSLICWKICRKNWGSHTFLSVTIWE